MSAAAAAAAAVCNIIGGSQLRGNQLHSGTTAQKPPKTSGAMRPQAPGEKQRASRSPTRCATITPGKTPSIPKSAACFTFEAEVAGNANGRRAEQTQP